MAKRKYVYNRNNFKPAPDKPHKIAQRKCLMCSVEFTSRHIGERVCSDCKSTTLWQSGHMGY